MAVGTRTVRVGRLRALTIMSALQEAVGDTLEAVGGGVVPGDRRPRPFNVELPVRGDGTDGNADAQRTAGERLRRQTRSLMDNQRVKLEGLYFHTLGDHELSGWIVVGGGFIEPIGQAHLARGEWKLVLQDCFKVATVNTHFDARRVELLDRRLSTTPRDYLGELYSTDFSGESPLAITFLPPGWRYAMGRMDLLAPIDRPGQDGAIGVVTDLMDGEVVTYEIREGSRHHGDVVAYDRRGVPSISALQGAAKENRVTNPSFEESTTGWTTGGTNTIARQYGPGREARSGHYGLKVTYSNSLTLLTFVGASLTFSEQWTFSIYVKIPRDWDGGQLSLDATNFTGSSGETNIPADMSIRDAWQRLSVTLTLGGGDAVGNFELLAASAPTVGRYVLADDAQVTKAATAPAYFDGDTRSSRWSGTPHASASVSYGDPEDFGWEEVYGENWAMWDHMDPLVLANGLCRVRLDATITTAVTFAIDAFNSSANGGYQEEGKVYCYVVTSPVEYFSSILATHLVEWTPERAVVHVHLGGATFGGVAFAASLYITLQRGWTAPRFELYGHQPAGGVFAGPVGIRYAPFDNNAQGIFTGEKVATNPVGAIISDEPGAAAGLVYDFTATDEPWAILNNSNLTATRHSVAVAVPDAIHTIRYETDTIAYGATRHTLVVAVPAGGTDYVSAQYHYLLAQPMLEAEAGTNGTGSSDVADANGRGGNAVESTNTAEPGDESLSFTEAQLDANLNTAAEGSLVGVWARVRVVTGGATGSIRFRTGAGSYSTTVTFTSTTFVWVRLGEAARIDGESLGLRFWRSAGTGNIRIDVVVAIPLERRGTIPRDFLGVRDFSDAALYDARQVPDLVAR